MAPLFALDIGTRSVVGIILEEKDSKYHVIDLEVIEHKDRSMIDGQIHNILSVASVIEEMKVLLEGRHGPLKKVSVAAAGRALKTAVGKMSTDITEHALINREDINRLELAAVQKAQQELMTSDSFTAENTYYCVGYSVLHYFLDDEQIGNLIDQTGRTASVEVIATFLPRVVVESLLAALKRADLEMEALTLEPIAAINVLIPQSMRKLNVALVDIGAGTSDIAITSRNTVSAFGMVPIAGDEVTEALSSQYLLDFPEAEYVKRQLVNSEAVTFTDILGFEQNMQSEDLIEALAPTVERLASSISNEVKRLNNQEAPQAVMLTGGGSLTPSLSHMLSTQLNLPAQRVAVRSSDALSEITMAPHLSASPAFVTPIGIAIAAQRAPIQYMSLTVNDKIIRLFELKEMNVGDALLAAGIKARQLYGKPGLALRFTLNNQEITLPGGHGSASTIMKNDQIASTKDSITNGDTIQLLLGNDGEPAHATIEDVVEKEARSLEITYNGQKIIIKASITVNGEKSDLQTVIQDRDKIDVTLSAALHDVLHSQGNLQSAESVQSVIMNGKRLQLKPRQPVYKRNGLPATLHTTLKNGDYIEAEFISPQTIESIFTELNLQPLETLTVSFNEQEVTITKPRFLVTVNGESVEQHTQVTSNDEVKIEEISNQIFTFSDVFVCTNFELPSGISSYQLLRNNEPIHFNEQLFTGDQLEIKLS